MRFCQPVSAWLLATLLAASGCGQNARTGLVDWVDTKVLDSAIAAAHAAPLTLTNQAQEASRPLAQAAPECPEGMVLVDGQYCPKVEHRCLRYVDKVGTPFGDFRCAEYAKPAKCLSERRHLRFCIDKDEFTPKGESLPSNFRSWTHATQACSSLGKRVCMESEWNFACEGEEMRPYPYGFSRDAAACNADHSDLMNREGKLKDLRAPSDAYPRCSSPFGVRNMAGNLEEFVTRDQGGPGTPAMKGAYWQPSRNFCRAAQTAHDRYYNGIETGFRCCGEAPPSSGN